MMKHKVNNNGHDYIDLGLPYGTILKTCNDNKHPYVDLGLPSGTLWATCNAGANKPSESGLYFQWGDTQGYTKDQIGTDKGKKEFTPDWSDYKWRSGNTFTKHTTKGEMLEIEDDAANANMGGSWHMPTPTQIQELINETTNTWTQQDNVNGYLFTSKNDPSKSIFIPAAGYAWNGSLHNEGREADVWSSMLNADDVTYGQYLDFFSNYVYLGYSNRCYGFSVRGVLG